MLNVFKHYAIEFINRVTFFKVYRLMVMAQPEPQWLALDPRYACRFIDSEEARAIARRPEFELSSEFIQTAGDKGDRCYAVFDGPNLASYGWYSAQATLIAPGLQLACAPGYTYMYHGFTHPDYRGRRLHAIRATRGLNEYLQAGSKGMIFYVEENNFRSLRSAARLNSVQFGWVLAVRLFGRLRVLHSRGCARYGLRIFVMGNS